MTSLPPSVSTQPMTSSPSAGLETREGSSGEGLSDDKAEKNAQQAEKGSLRSVCLDFVQDSRRRSGKTAAFYTDRLEHGKQDDQAAHL